MNFTGNEIVSPFYNKILFNGELFNLSIVMTKDSAKINCKRKALLINLIQNGFKLFSINIDPFNKEIEEKLQNENAEIIGNGDEAFTVYVIKTIIDENNNNLIKTISLCCNFLSDKSIEIVKNYFVCNLKKLDKAFITSYIWEFIDEFGYTIEIVDLICDIYSPIEILPLCLKMRHIDKLYDFLCQSKNSSLIDEYNKIFFEVSHIKNDLENNKVTAISDDEIRKKVDQLLVICKLYNNYASSQLEKRIDKLFNSDFFSN